MECSYCLHIGAIHEGSAARNTDFCAVSQKTARIAPAMFIGHLPASYLVTCALDTKAPDLVPKRLRPLAVKVFLLAGIFPDIDLLYFYLIDNRSQHHHLYWTHLPFCWLVLYMIFLVRPSPENIVPSYLLLSLSHAAL
ncbi:hypothetical protein LJC47_01630 [Desulfosarcina sp. OttesenSCG-928-B08]|nr:hypothetical protein [Desulfosarcina sp. OttesenSCG-928-B08]